MLKEDRVKLIEEFELAFKRLDEGQLQLDNYRKSS